MSEQKQKFYDGDLIFDLIMEHKEDFTSFFEEHYDQQRFRVTQYQDKDVNAFFGAAILYLTERMPDVCITL